MRRIGVPVIAGGVLLAALLLVRAADRVPVSEEQLWRYRNLGKAFYENPTTQLQAVGEFKQALDLNPKSARERLNYGLSLLRAGKTKEGIAEIEGAQQQDPKIPHTWFNLGIVYKKESEYDRAIQQLEQMAKLVPDEPVTHYNLGVLYKLTGKAEQSLKEFEISSRLDANLAGPHFQLYNAYRQAGRTDDASRELKLFQDIKKVTQGAAVPEDMEWSFYSEILDTVDPREDLDKPAAVKLTASEVKVPASGIADLDSTGQGRVDLVAWSTDSVTLLEGGSKPVADSGLSHLKGVRAIVPGDFNNDGLADLAVLTASGAQLFMNQKGKFAAHGAALPAGRFENAVWVDYDHDYDLDLLLLGENSRLARNNGEAGFSDQTAAFPFVKGAATRGTVFELISDTSGSDLVVLYKDRAPVLYKDKLLSKFEAAPLDQLPSGSMDVAVRDFNNDGWMDLAIAGPQGVSLVSNLMGKLTVAASLSAKGPLAFADIENRAFSDLIASGAVFRNQGQGKFQAGDVKIPAGSAAVEADFDGDGRIDLAVAAGGSVHLLRNETAGSNHWVRVSLAGVKNLKLAPGAEVEVKAGSRYQKQIYRGLPLVFGLRSMTQADTVRITWPNGLIQNEPKQASNKPLAYKEAQRLSGSCPMIFTWNGREFEFITDVLGVAPLGASAGDGRFFPVDHDEFIQIPGGSLKPVDGRYEMRITEELREVSYIDHVRLMAVDHPADLDVFTNDKFKSPPFPPFRLYGVRRKEYPRSAWLKSRTVPRTSVTERLRVKDRQYPDQFRRDYSGIAELHSLELDFGRSAPANRAVLVLSGWVDWADGSTFLGASQASRDGLILPYLQVKNPKGDWQTVIDDLGIPAGKPKTIAVDLSGKFLSESRQVRIVTNLCVYWDEIFLGDDTSAPNVKMTPLRVESAGLRFRGFSQPVIHPERKQPESFIYSKVAPASMWNPTPGLYTRFGDVRRLIERIDDDLLLMGSGDELRLSFAAAGLPALPAGWTRDFLLMVDGWAKDGDANTAFSQSVEPLPFHAMSGYPYPDSERRSDSALQKEMTTRPALRLLRPLTEMRRR